MIASHIYITVFSNYDLMTFSHGSSVSMSNNQINYAMFDRHFL